MTASEDTIVMEVSTTELADVIRLRIDTAGRITQMFPSQSGI